MNASRPQFTLLLLAAALHLCIGCDNSPKKVHSVAPVPTTGTAPESGKSENSAFRNIGPTTIDGKSGLAVEVVDEAKLSTMSDQATPEELAAWSEVELPKLELLSIRRADRAGMVVPLSDGKRYLLASEFPELWDASSQKPIRVYRDEPQEVGNATESMAVSHDGKWFVATDKAGTLRQWEIETGSLIAKKVIAKGNVVSVAVSPDSSQLLVNIADQPARLLDAKTLEQKKEVGKAESGMTAPHFIGTQFCAIVGQRAQIYDLLSDTPVAEFTSQPPITSSLGIDNRLYFRDRSAFGSWDATTRSRKNHWNGQAVDIIANAGNGLAWTGAAEALTLVDLSSGKILQYIESSQSEKAFQAPIVGLAWLADAKALVVASSNGLIRVWGTKETADKLGLKPLSSTTASSSASVPNPLNLSQLRGIIDLRQLPRLERRGNENINEPFNQHYIASEGLSKCKRFYRHILSAHGWKEVPTADSLRRELLFEKNDYTLVVQLKKVDDDTTEIVIGTTGYYDLSSLPPTKGLATEVLTSSRNALTYKTKASRLDIESQLLRQRTEEGWSFVKMSGVSGVLRYSDYAQLSFVRNGILLQAVITPYMASPNERQVSWSARPKAFWSPIPPGSDCIDIRGGDVLVETSLPLSDAMSTYDRLLAEDGWTRFESQARPDGHATRYVRGQLDLLLHFQPTQQQTVLVKQGMQRDDYLPWINHSVEAASFPILEPLDAVKFNRVEQWIEFSTRAAREKIRESYARYFERKGLATRLLPKDDGSATLQFTNVRNTVVLTMLLHADKEVTTVRIQGPTLEWTAALPSDPPQLMSFEEWLRAKAYRPAIRYLDAYVGEMNKLLTAAPTAKP